MALASIKQNPLVFLQILLYFLLCLFGFFICIPMGYQLRNFHGSCILFSQIVWDGHFIYPWADSTCEFVLYSNLGVNVIYAFIMGLFLVITVWPRTGPRHYEKVAEVEEYNVRHMMGGVYPVFCFINLVLSILMLCSAATLTAGFAQFCNWLLESLDEQGIDVGGSCAKAQGLNWNEYRIRGGTSMGVRGEHFFDNIATAIFFSWATVIIWLLLLIISFSRVCRRCSCEVAEEKKKYDKSMAIAARRSRLATPIGTPGGGLTPVPMGVPMPQPYRAAPSSSSGPPPQYGHLNPQTLMGAPPARAGQYR